MTTARIDLSDIVDSAYKTGKAFLSASAVRNPGLTPELIEFAHALQDQGKATLGLLTYFASQPFEWAKGMLSAATIFAPHLEQLGNHALRVAGAPVAYIREATKLHKAPEIPVSYEKIWENELVTLNRCSPDNYSQPKDIGDESFILFPPVMRGPFLGFYTEPGKPDKIKSVGKAIFSSHAGSVYFIDYKPLDANTKNSGIRDYLETFHSVNSEVERDSGNRPIDINLCQPGYFDILRLAKYPDDCKISVLVASPHKTIDPDSILYDSIIAHTREDLEIFVSRSKGIYQGTLLAGSWENANFPLYKRKMVDEPYEMLIGIMDGTYDADRRDTFRSWMDHDVRDVPGPTILDICDIFSEEYMLEDAPYGYSQKNYKNPLIAVIGEKDNIVTPRMALSVFDSVGTPSYLTDIFMVQGGHAAVFNGSAAFMKRRPDRDDWMEDIIPSIQRLSAHLRRIETYS